MNALLELAKVGDIIAKTDANLNEIKRLGESSYYGNGNKAARREAVVRSFTDTERQLHEIFAGLGGMGIGLSPSDVDRFAEQWTESRTLKPRRNLAHP